MPARGRNAVKTGILAVLGPELSDPHGDRDARGTPTHALFWPFWARKCGTPPRRAEKPPIVDQAQNDITHKDARQIWDRLDALSTTLCVT